MRKPENLTLYYIYLAVACGATGTVLTFVVLFYCEYYGIDIATNLWVLAIPITLSLFLNIITVEIIRWYKQR